MSIARNLKSLHNSQKIDALVAEKQKIFDLLEE